MNIYLKAGLTILVMQVILFIPAWIGHNANEDAKVKVPNSTEGLLLLGVSSMLIFIGFIAEASIFLKWLWSL